MVPGRLLALHALACIAAIAVSGFLGSGYRGRLSDPRGFFPVTVEDAPHAPPPPRPRRAVVVVFDGLGHVDAEALGSLAHLAALGQCRLMDTSPLTVSRPVYATLSTGIEADRHGCRDNGCDGALAAQSIWSLARRAGLRTTAISELPWWRDSFPDGFDDYRLADRATDFLAAAPPGDLQLIHPLYLDETAHEHGAASAEFRAELRRADRELWALLGRLDLSRDLLVVTADHGHTLRGGHGGHQDRVARVTTCFAGLGVLPGSHAAVQHNAAEPLPATAFAPSLSLLLGLPFPSGMRAGLPEEDRLDALFSIADTAHLPAARAAAWAADRRAALERFREANRRRLDEWSMSAGGSWERFYEESRTSTTRRGLPAVIALLLLLAWKWRRRGCALDFLFAVAWIALILVAGVALQILLRGSFDLSSVSTRAPFIRFTVTLGATVGLIAFALHLLVRRSLTALLRDHAALMLVGTLCCLAHPLCFGYRLGFPIPSPAGYFFPFFATLYVIPLAALGLLLTAACGAGISGRR